MNSKRALEEQNQHLHEIGEVTDQLYLHANNMRNEINKQAKIAIDLEKQMDETTDKMNFVQKKLSVLLKTEDQSKLRTIMTLTSILMVLIFLVVVL